MKTSTEDGAPRDGAPWVKSERQLERERRRRRAGVRSASLATVSSLLFVAVVAGVVVSSPGWPRVHDTFFDWGEFTGALPDVLRGFWLNVQIFLIAEPLILLLGLLVALARGLRNPLFFPLRALAIAYTDVFRGIPTILLVYLVGFGLPALQLQGVPDSPAVLGGFALVLSYGAYVAEVFRAGIDSVHPSQRAAARSLGLSRAQALRFVVLPQAVRRVVPPLLNDFASLQKDTALVAVLGPLEALRQAQIHSAETFDYTPYLAAAVLFVALTVPLARFTDHLAARAERRRAPGGGT
ncbi:amino acid ABC transporter permease [Actinomadura algeriensis]|uniref:Polar amino acid transport system permease protein n=1 Tax=Actinomadura algeriensis TaxID=1679523 RepID=A0ABR9JX82_9ACTN|nr:amino acid ABC transporter permease [Actinomadura algeriensis]MBE1534720.1 polar amino acid transport system permease protein [Actinomadura algeriensis]